MHNNRDGEVSSVLVIELLMACDSVFIGVSRHVLMIASSCQEKTLDVIKQMI